MEKTGETKRKMEKKRITRCFDISPSGAFPKGKLVEVEAAAVLPRMPTAIQPSGLLRFHLSFSSLKWDSMRRKAVSNSTFARKAIVFDSFMVPNPEDSWQNVFGLQLCTSKPYLVPDRCFSGPMGKAFADKCRSFRLSLSAAVLHWTLCRRSKGTFPFSRC